MTVETTNITSGPYTGNGLSDEYDYDFRITDKTQLIVYETDDDGVQTVLEVDTDYTVAGIGEDEGGTITRVAGNLPTGYVWYIRSNYAATQTTAFASQGGFFPRVHELTFDKITFLIQQLIDRVSRSIRFSDGYSGSASPTISGPSPNAYLRWNADGTQLENSDDLALDGDGSAITGLTKAQVGLGNVDNTSDANKPISTATQTALNAKQDALSVPSQAEAEAGTATTPRAWTAQRVAQAIAELASGGIAYTTVTGATTLVTKQGVVANSSGGSFSLTLPATPEEGDIVSIVDGGDWLADPVTVLRNGSTIEGSADDLYLNMTGAAVDMIFDGTTWRVVATVRGSDVGAPGVPGPTGATGATGATGPAGPAVVVDIQVFNTAGSHTWTKPADAGMTLVEAIAGGGGGANGTGGGSDPLGGSGGEYVNVWLDADDLGATESVTVGAGGAGGANTTDDDGSPGGNSSFGSHLTAVGGNGGRYTSSLVTTIPRSASGSSLVTAVAQALEQCIFPQAGASFPSFGARTINGGGGGGGGLDGPGGVSEFGGDGGDGNDTAATPAQNGSSPGGGGGGSKNDGGGGNGGDGWVRVTTFRKAS